MASGLSTNQGLCIKAHFIPFSIPRKPRAGDPKEITRCNDLASIGWGQRPGSAWGSS